MNGFLPHKEIKIKYLEDAAQLCQTDSGGCCDLYNYEETHLKAGEWAFINLGVAMELPEGWDAIILPRSSTFKNWGIILTNSIGYIDNSYNGDDDIWQACVYATRDVVIPQDTRCFQFRLIPTQRLYFTEVDELGNENREGFGSTGL